MPRQLSESSKAVCQLVEQQGYRIGVAENNGVWHATAKRDGDGQFHHAKAESEAAVVSLLAEMVGVEFQD